MDFEAMGPLFEVGFLGVAFGGIAGEAGGDDEMGAAAEEFESGLVADFDAAAGEEGNAAGQVGEFGSLAKVEFGAGGAHLVVEVMDLGVLLLADVAVEGFGGLAGLLFGRGGREVVRGGEDGFAAEGADAGLVEEGGGAFDIGGAAFAFGGFQAGTAGDGVGVEELGDDAVESFALRGGEAFEQVAVGV
jgi:hypothetical protein